MTDNEKQFIRTFVDFESNLNSARQYIKETYGVDTLLMKLLIVDLLMLFFN